MLKRKAIAKQGYHQFKIGEEIEFIGEVTGLVYSAEDIYDFENNEGISQHLVRHEFEWIR